MNALLLVLVATLLVPHRKEIDIWLCKNLPWFLQIPWCELWVREDFIHPSHEYNGDVLNSKKCFYRKALKLWIDATRHKHQNLNTPEEHEAEKQRLYNLCAKIEQAYYFNLEKRQGIVWKREFEKSTQIVSPSQ